MHIKKLTATATLTAAIAALGVGTATAQQFEQQNLYVGAGIGNNSVTNRDSAIGYQIFAGYHFHQLDLGPIGLAAEVGYMDSGDFSRTGEPDTSADGLWTSAVLDYAFGPQVRLLGRLGVDFGDDDGLLAGIGVGFSVNPNIEVRGEFVSRDNIDSVQANVLYHF